jgi:hypothetical protein
MIQKRLYKVNTHTHLTCPALRTNNLLQLIVQIKRRLHLAHSKTTGTISMKIDTNV